MNQPAPDMSKKVVNSNLGVSNIIPEKHIRTTMMQTLSDLAETLKPHCGPYARNAILAPQVHSMGEPVFTTDGINIIKSIEYANPLQEFVRSMIVYIGDRIDTAGADGTTSSMIVTVKALEGMLTRVRPEHTCAALKNEYSRFRTLVFKELDSIKKMVDDCSWDDKDMKTHPAYLQPLTSSKGDEELAKISWELFKATPRSAWDYVTFERALIETKQKYELEIDDHDYTAQCTPLTKSVLRGEDGVSVVEQNTDLMVFNQVLMFGSPYWGEFTNIVDQHLKDNTSLTLVIKDSVPQQTELYLDEILADSSNNKIHVFTVNLQNEQLNDINNLLLLSGRDPGNLHQQFTSVIPVKMQYAQGSLIIDDLVPEERDDTGICPLCKDTEKYETYNRVIEAIPGYIEDIRNDTRDPSAGRKARDLQSLLNKLRLSKRTKVVIGGNAYDNHEAVDVCIDSLGATRNTLLYGYTQGGMTSLSTAILRVRDKNLSPIINHYCDAFTKAIVELMLTTCQCAPEHIKKKHRDYLTSSFSETSGLFDVTTGEVTTDIIQPVTIDKELISRFGEVALKFISSSKVLIPHSVFKPDSNKEPEVHHCKCGGHK